MAADDTWHYLFTGTAGNGQTWQTEGNVICDFIDVLTAAAADSFSKLTHGNAVYGFPGLCCVGPYKVDKVILAKGTV